MSHDPSPHLRVRRTALGGVTIVSFVSPYLQSEAEIEKVGADLTDLVDAPECNKILLTFDGVRFVSSSMLAQVVKLQKKLTKAKGRLRLCSLTPALRDVVQASQLDKLFEVFDDEAAALTKF